MIFPVPPYGYILAEPIYHHPGQVIGKPKPHLRFLPAIHSEHLTRINRHIELLELLRNKLLFAWNNSMFESSEYLLWPIDSNWTFYITQPQFLPTQLIRAYSTIYMLFLYAANILSAGVALFRKKINFTFIPNLFVFGTMLYLLIFENAPRRAMIAVPFMIYNVIFLLSQWRDKPDGAQLAERFRMRIHKN